MKNRDQIRSFPLERVDLLRAPFQGPFVGHRSFLHVCQLFLNPFQTLIEFVNLISTPIDCFFQRGNRLFLIRNLFLVPLFTGTERGDGFIASLDRFSSAMYATSSKRCTRTASFTARCTSET